MEIQIEQICSAARDVAQEIVNLSGVKSGQLIVVGCSTSEIAGARIGTGGSEEIAGAVLAGLGAPLKSAGIYLAVQCCEHLNRALVVERAAMEQYGLEQVEVLPVRTAGGALAAAAMRNFCDPVVVECVAAHAGLDIGSTLIGMHLRQVAVPVRLTVNRIGEAAVVAARTRPKLIGGARAVYPK